MRILPAGDAALLVELDDLAQATALCASLTLEPIAGAGEPVPCARTLLVPFRPHEVTAPALAAALRARPLVRPDDGAARVVEIPTAYDGEDLAALAALLGWSPEELVRRHTGARWTVGFMGFAPGFAYLTCADPSWPLVPRLGSPRTRVPAGSVALAGPYAGVYPRVSPGGWQLVGRTDAVIWDVNRTPPALWTPGDEVRFTQAPGPPGTSSTNRHLELPVSRQTAGQSAGEGALVVTLGEGVVEDLGRRGVAHLGVGTSGAADPRSLRAANRAVGSAAGAAAIETEGPLTVRAEGDVVIALAGALAAGTVTRAEPPRGSGRGGSQDAFGGPSPASSRTAPFGMPFLLRDGETLSLATPVQGRRTYLAARGGLDVPHLLGSRSTDTLGGIGPARLAPGTRLPVGTDRAAAVETGNVGAPDPASLPAAGRTTTLHVVAGPHDDWFDDGVATLTGQEWEVTALADRVGVRLTGQPLRRAATHGDAELPSEGMVTGAVQVPPSGQPILFLPDHPVTGGYPPVAVVVEADLHVLGQLPTGALVRFELRQSRIPAAVSAR